MNANSFSDFIFDVNYRMWIATALLIIAVSVMYIAFYKDKKPHRTSHARKK